MQTIERRVSQVEKWTRGHARTAALAFFNDALDDAKVLHESARRLSPRSRRPTFDEQQAANVCHRARDLMMRLSERITEAQERRLVQADFFQADFFEGTR